MPFSLIQKLVDLPHVFIDFETTGASANYGDRAIELGMVRVERGVKIAEYQQLFDPDRRVSAGITAITGITTEMVAGRPRFGDQIETILQFMRGAIVLGHNVRFDLSFMQHEVRRCRRDLAEELGPGVLVMDTVRIARRRFGRGGNGLQKLSRRLGITPVVAHRALADAQTTHLVYEQLLAPVGGWDLMLCDALGHQGGMMGLLPASKTENPLPLELEEALELKRPVLMEYLDARDRRTERVILPLQVRRFRNETLLVAHCELRNDRRTFKLDRIIELRRIDSGQPSTPNVCDAPVDPVAEGPTLFAEQDQFARKFESSGEKTESTIDDAEMAVVPNDVALPLKDPADTAADDNPLASNG